MMRHPGVQEAIQQRLEKQLRRMDVTELTVAAVIEELDAIRDAAIAAGSGSWQAQTRLKVAELKGRHLAMWKDKLEIGIDEELIKRLEEGRKRAFIPALPAKEPEIEQPTAG